MGEAAGSAVAGPKKGRPRGTQAAGERIGFRERVVERLNAYAEPEAPKARGKAAKAKADEQWKYLVLGALDSDQQLAAALTGGGAEVQQQQPKPQPPPRIAYLKSVTVEGFRIDGRRGGDLARDSAGVHSSALRTTLRDLLQHLGQHVRTPLDRQVGATELRTEDSAIQNHESDSQTAAKLMQLFTSHSHHEEFPIAAAVWKEWPPARLCSATRRAAGRLRRYPRLPRCISAGAGTSRAKTPPPSPVPLPPQPTTTPPSAETATALE